MSVCGACLLSPHQPHCRGLVPNFPSLLSRNLSGTITFWKLSLNMFKGETSILRVQWHEQYLIAMYFRCQLLRLLAQE